MPLGSLAVLGLTLSMNVPGKYRSVAWADLMFRNEVSLNVLLFFLLNNMAFLATDDLASYLLQVVKAATAPKIMILGQAFF